MSVPGTFFQNLEPLIVSRMAVADPTEGRIRRSLVFRLAIYPLLPKPQRHNMQRAYLVDESMDLSI